MSSQPVRFEQRLGKGKSGGQVGKDSSVNCQSKGPLTPKLGKVQTTWQGTTVKGKK